MQNEIDRNKGVKCFSFVLKHEKNCILLEKYIFEKCKNNIDKYNWFIYQTIGMLLKDKQNMRNICNNVKEGNIGWKSPVYNDIAFKIEEHDDYLLKPVEVVEGVSTCPKCKNNKTWSIQKQVRGSDEPMTTFSRCVTCDYQWSYSG